MYRLTIETLLGLNLEVDHLRIAPCIPANWQSYKIYYRYLETTYHISIKRVDEQMKNSICVLVDGTEVNTDDEKITGRLQGQIPLANDRKEHFVEVKLSRSV
jgi:cellobiose phosphorylase